jgi:tetraacyldisaccharide 4'-kinase
MQVLPGTCGLQTTRARVRKSLGQFGLDAISGADSSPRASLARGIAGIVEPFYSLAMRTRNVGYDRAWLTSHSLGRPTVSVGNITTGGTGKTPVVQWLARRLLDLGKHPAILLRGYKSAPGQAGDEAQVLLEALNVPVQENPSRVQAAAAVLQNHPGTDLFILDDAFQHRRARRDFNLVLISATSPFGFGHVLPRGLLREPLVGLKRADAFLVTRSSLVDPSQLLKIDRLLSEVHSSAPVYHCDHHLPAVWLPLQDQTLPVESLIGRKVFVIAGIADPLALKRQIDSLGCQVAGTRWFDDHHRFIESDIQKIVDSAIQAGGELVLTTQKDWVKMRPKTSKIPIGVLQLELRFPAQDESRLLDQIQKSLPTL